MNKTIFATTALATGLVVTPLLAAEAPTATVRGYVNAGMYYGELAGTSGDFGVEHDSEIHFRWSGSSDNGLTFKGEVELEGFSNADQIDEYWTSVSGSFGDFRIGADDTAAEYMELGIIYAPYAKVGYYDAFNYTGAANGTDSNGDDLGIYYITPAISGFTAAISFQPEGNTDGLPGHGPNPAFKRNNASGIDDVLAVGAQWMGEFDGVSLGISGGYQTSDTDTLVPTNADPDTWNTGGYIGYAGFTLAAFYEDNAGIGGFATGGYDVAVGASYETGPWTFAGGWAGIFDTKAGGANDSDTFSGWVTYAIAPGVTGTLAVEYTEFDAGPVDDNLIAGAYMSVSF
ncbi:porin [uncultured Albimonas sp.]|uniref:porin n=1 Tax=uncultured Albimonas sp. TaxID=1331701 RepID=UPI0030EC190B|tara:strand:+ start:8640 stop:9671 length:1032 start_codon:yes stop_codon:yes gene_type:complete